MHLSEQADAKANRATTPVKSQENAARPYPAVARPEHAVAQWNRLAQLEYAKRDCDSRSLPPAPTHAPHDPGIVRRLWEVSWEIATLSGGNAPFGANRSSRPSPTSGEHEGCPVTVP
jgi:hypothetical protein